MDNAGPKTNYTCVVSMIHLRESLLMQPSRMEIVRASFVKTNGSVINRVPDILRFLRYAHLLLSLTGDTICIVVRNVQSGSPRARGRPRKRHGVNHPSLVGAGAAGVFLSEVRTDSSPESKTSQPLDTSSILLTNTNTALSFTHSSLRTNFLYSPAQSTHTHTHTTPSIWSKQVRGAE